MMLIKRQKLDSGRFCTRRSMGRWLVLVWVFSGLVIASSWAANPNNSKNATGAAAEGGRGVGGGAGGGAKTEKPANRENKEGREGRPSAALTPEQIATVLQILREHNPALAQRLEEALEKYPDRAQRILAEQWPRLGRLLDLKQRDPQTFELTLTEIKLMGQARDLVVDWRAAMKNRDTAQADQIKQQLVELMGQMFDIAQQLRLREAERLEEKAKELRDQVQDRQSERDDLIQRRLEEFLKRPGASSSPSSPFGPSPGSGPGDGASPPPPPPMGHGPAEPIDQPS